MNASITQLIICFSGWFGEKYSSHSLGAGCHSLCLTGDTTSYPQHRKSPTFWKILPVDKEFFGFQ